MRNRHKSPVIWVSGLLNKMVVYTSIMTGFMLIFYFFSGRQRFSDKTVNGIINLILVFSMGTFFFALSAIVGRIWRNRYVSHLKRQPLIFLMGAMVFMIFVILLFSLLIVLQTGYGY